jgi:hypothetical protein
MHAVTIVVLVESLSMFPVVIGHFLGDIEQNWGLVARTPLD